MNLRKTLCIFAVAATVAASAQAGQPAATHGRGQAVGRNHQPAAFLFHAIKNDQTNVRAKFNFRTRLENGNIVAIEMAQPGRLATRGNTATFTGQAALTVITGDRREVFRGQVTVEVKDLVQPDRGNRGADEAISDQATLPSLDFDLQPVRDGQSDRDHRRRRDSISVSFTSPQTDRTFSYTGAVVHGNILVRNQSDR